MPQVIVNLMAMALEARGFGVGKRRTFYLQLRMRGRDWVALFITAIVTAVGIWLALQN